VSAGFGVEGDSTKSETETQAADRKKVVETSDRAIAVNLKAEPAWHQLQGRARLPIRARWALQAGSAAA